MLPTRRYRLLVWAFMGVAALGMVICSTEFFRIRGILRGVEQVHGAIRLSRSMAVKTRRPHRLTFSDEDRQLMVITRVGRPASEGKRIRLEGDILFDVLPQDIVFSPDGSLRFREFVSFEPLGDSPYNLQMGDIWIRDGTDFLWVGFHLDRPGGHAGRYFFLRKEGYDPYPYLLEQFLWLIS